MRKILATAFLSLAIGEAAPADVVLNLNLDVNSAEDGSGTDYGNIAGTITFDDTLANMTHWDFTYTPNSVNSFAPAFTFTDTFINITGEFESGSYTQDFTYASQVQPYSEFFFEYVDTPGHYNYTLSLATVPGVTLTDGTNTFNQVVARDDVDLEYQTGTGRGNNLMTSFGYVLGTLAPPVSTPEPSTLVSAVGGAIMLLAASSRARRRSWDEVDEPGSN